MVEGDDQDVLLIMPLQQTQSNQRAARQIERMLCFFGNRSFDLVVAPSDGDHSEIDFLLYRDDLHGSAVLRGERRPQDFMSPYDVIERTQDGLPVEHTLHSHGDRGVVGCALGLKLRQKPQSTLRKTHRKHIVLRLRALAWQCLASCNVVVHQFSVAALDGSAIATRICRRPLKGVRPCAASILSSINTSPFCQEN